MNFDEYTAELAQGTRLEAESVLSRARRNAIRVMARVTASPQRVFDAWLDATLTGKWLFATASRPTTDVQIDARLGGTFRFVERSGAQSVEHTGVYVELAAPRRLAFTLSTAEQPQLVTRVSAEIAALRRGCRVTVTHEGLPREHAERIETRWTGMLYGLAQTLNTRIMALRVMTGNR